MKKILVLVMCLAIMMPSALGCAPGRHVEKVHREKEIERDDSDVKGTAYQLLKQADTFRDQHPYDIGDQEKMYLNVISRFPDTSAAKEAAARIEELKNDRGYGTK
jgi:hypothetical protein